MPNTEKGPSGPVQPNSGRASATKVGKGWEVTFDDEFMMELEQMPPAEKAEIEKLVQGLRDGTIDPMAMGIAACGYCGDAMTDEDQKREGTNICSKCAKTLV